MHAGSQAAAVISIQEVGSDVVATGTGSLNLAGFSYSGIQSGQSLIIPSLPFIRIGAPGSYDFYSLVSVSGPSDFGSGGGAFTSSGSGGLFGFDGSVGAISVPLGYVSSGPLSATATFTGQSLNSLGARPGTYNYLLGNGDTFRVQIGPASPIGAVPEPSSLAAMTLAGIAFVTGMGARRRGGRKASSQGIS